uniref:Ubiquitin-like protease family profile domain-containing protein n=1 Tax=Gasterosteus aculeatus aculeatus TaxID=481459 RepID=A0AAQ4RSN9_GASAC
MVHSGSASPMKASPSPHLTAPAPAPPPQAAPPLVPPRGNTTDQDVTPAKLLATDHTSNSVLTPVVPDVPSTKSLGAPLSRASSWSSTHSPSATLSQVNGRTSGRKRTPKACDCCGPGSTGHSVPTLGRWRGRGRGRGRGAGRDLKDTPKRKVEGQLTHIKCFDLTTKNVVEAKDDGDGGREKLHTTLVMADTPSQADIAPPVTVSLPDVPLRNHVTPEKRDTQKTEDPLIAGSGSKGGGHSGDVEMMVSTIAGRGAKVGTGRGMMGPLPASDMDVAGGTQQGGLGVVVYGSKMDGVSPLVFVQRQGQNKASDMDHGGQDDPSSIQSSFGNGDTVNLSDTEPEEDTKEGDVMREMENGLLDSDMQVDESRDQTNFPLTLSNGNVTSPTNAAHCSTLMEVEASHPAVVAPPLQGPVTVLSVQYSWALRDHGLYCQPGTWVGAAMEAASEKTNGQELGGEKQNSERLEQLTDMIHEFLESFYLKYGSFNPLTESDVLEYLKKKGNSDLSSKELDIKRKMTRYRAGLASAPIAGFMVSYNKHTLGLEDLGTLEEQNWLNDQVKIINMYGELLMEATQHKVHFFNSFFHKQLVAKGYDGVKRWTKKVDLFSKWLLLFPIHLEIHWSLITVTMATKTISYYDSQGIVFRHTTDVRGIPQQKNDSDCGVFVLEYCRCLSVKQPLLFSQEDMPLIRKRIHKELCDCHLSD